MTYTRDEWEPASQEAAKISKQAWESARAEPTLSQAFGALEKTFEDAIIFALIAVAWRDKEIAELREKLISIKKALGITLFDDDHIISQIQHVTDEVLRCESLEQEVAELREKLAAAEVERDWWMQCEMKWMQGEMKLRIERMHCPHCEERDRLRKALEQVKDRFAFWGFNTDQIDEALAQPTEGTK